MIFGLVPFSESCIVGLQASRNMEQVISSIICGGRNFFISSKYRES
jgi:hypothetical protein